MKILNNVYLTFVSILLFTVTGCSDDTSYEGRDLDNLPKEGRIFTLTASTPSTRVALTEEIDNGVTLSWEEGDVIQLVLVQDETEIAQPVTVSSISGNGKSAQFIFTIPDEINDGEFDLYGVYGGGGLSSGDPTLAVLPANSGASKSLNSGQESVQEREDMMLYFSERGVQTENPQVNITFIHLGSLFHLALKNSDDTSLENIAEVRIKGPEGVNWSHNFAAGGGTFDLVNGVFTATNPTGDYISFKSPENSLSPGESMSFWAWYPPHPDLTWPNLSLELRDASGNLLYTSINSHSPRTTATATGKSYYFFAEWNGVTLQFTDQDGNITKNIKEFRNINLGAQHNTEYGQCINTKTGSVHKFGEGVAGISETIDIVSFYSGGINSFVLAAPANPNAIQYVYNLASSGDDALSQWPVRHNTIIKSLSSDFTNANFESIDSYEDIKTLFDNTEGTGSNISDAFMNGRSVVIKTADGRYAVIYKSWTTDNGPTGYITVHMKV